MPDNRPAIPTAIRRAVLFEAGYRCAIPTCRAETTEFAHIIPWAETQNHSVENLIALCPTHHARYDKGEIHRSAIVGYKANLAIVSGRYHTLEQRLLDFFVKDPSLKYVSLADDKGFEFFGLLEDGLIEYGAVNGGLVVNGLAQGPFEYRLTAKGQSLVEELRRGDQVGG